MLNTIIFLPMFLLTGSILAWLIIDFGMLVAFWQSREIGEFSQRVLGSTIEDRSSDSVYIPLAIQRRGRFVSSFRAVLVAGRHGNALIFEVSRDDPILVDAVSVESTSPSGISRVSLTAGDRKYRALVRPEYYDQLSSLVIGD